MEEQAYMHTTTTQWPVLPRIRPKINIFVPMHSQNPWKTWCFKNNPNIQKFPQESYEIANKTILLNFLIQWVIVTSEDWEESTGSTS